MWESAERRGSEMAGGGAAQRKRKAVLAQPGMFALILVLRSLTWSLLRA